MAYRRRSNYKRSQYNSSNPWKTTRSDSKSKTSLAAYLNPFSPACAAPKIPDGKATLSCANRCSNVQAVFSGQSTPLIIFLYAGYSAGAVCIKDDRLNLDYGPCDGIIPGRVGGTPVGWDFDDADPIFESSVYRIGRVMGALYSRHPKLPLEWKTEWDNAPDLNLEIPIKKWRVVSQATKIMHVNNLDNDEGWFEAIRVAPSPNNFELMMAQGIPLEGREVEHNTRAEIDGAREYQNLVSWPNEDYIVNRNFAENPSYTTGRLRDIGKYIFQLHPLNNQHEFRDPIEDTRHASMLVDDGYDMIVIKLHVKKTTTNGEIGSNVVISTVCNQEHIYDEKNIQAKSHTECFKDLAGLSRAQSILGSSQKAGKRISS